MKTPAEKKKAAAPRPHHPEPEAQSPDRAEEAALPMLARFQAAWIAFNDAYDEFFYAPYRAAVAREQRDQEDLFLLLCFSDLLGIPNPVNYYTLELLPYLYEEFHEWHLRQGMEHSPLDAIKCC